MTYVVDASLVVGLLANRQVDEVLRQRLSAPRTLHAPHLIDAEVISGLRSLVLGKKVTAERAGTMLTDFTALRITRHAMLPHLERVLELRENFTAYDAMYLATAEALKIPLLTRDAKIGRGVGHRVEVRICP